MSYIGSTPTTQSFIAGTDYFNGTGSQVAFTLSRAVNSVNDIEVIVNNVEQIPSGYTVSGTTLTFSVAPSAGTDNVYVRYLSTTLQSITVPAGTTVGGDFGVAGNLTVSANSTTNALRITQTGTGNALLVEDSTNPDATPFVIDAVGSVITGHTQSQTIAGAAYQYQMNGSNPFSAIRWNSSNSLGLTALLGRSRSGTVGVNSIVAANDVLGTLTWAGDDGTAFVQAASISAAVDGTPGTNDMPGRLVFSTTADGASAPTERMRIRSDGNIAIGGVGTADSTLLNTKTNTGGTAAFGYRLTNNTASDVTDTSTGYYCAMGTDAAAFTLTNLRHFAALQRTFGAGSVVTNQFGFHAESTLVGATNNYGFYSALPAGTGDWNFYAAGTANNYFAGNVGIGSGKTVPATALDVNGTVTATTFSGAGTSLTGTAASLSIGGNAATATTLATGRTIAITGDLAYTSGSFNGSANVTGTGTLANSGVAAGSYTLSSITVDAKGRVTAASTGSAPAPTTAQVMSAIAASALNDVGSYAFARKVVNASPQTAGQNTAGTDLRYSDTGNNASGPVINVGTWRCLGHQSFGDRTVLWLRIS